MKESKYRKNVEDMLALADIGINSPKGKQRPWDIKVHNENFYKRVLAEGSLALGESYIDGWWDCEKLDEFFFHILRAELDKKIKPDLSLLLNFLRKKFFNPQKISKAFDVGKKHYDLGNDLFKIMLDKKMVYSCGYWKNAKTLDESQEVKFELICKKIGLKKGDKVLEIGCGWGSFLKYVSEKYKVSGVGLTVSKEQAEFARNLCKNLPVEILLQDYRSEINGASFDHIISIGMFEHVGVKNYKKFMQIVHRNLKKDGLFLLHTIGGNKSRIKNDPWIEKYVFPRGMLPSIKQIGESVENLFVVEDWHNFGADYDKTLMAWHDNFNKSWDKIKSNYDERFYRIWKYYLLSCAGSFRARKNQLWQIVFSKNGVEGGYKSIR